MSAATKTPSRLQRAGDQVFDAMIHGVEWIARRHPATDPARYDVEVTADVPYLLDGDPAHRLDVYRPRRAAGPLPAVIYLHGGGFRHLSKETLWFAALTFARRGYVVFNVEYRLGARCPAALEDVSAAATWVKRHGALFGADVEQLVVAGESAGGNLATAIAIASSYRRPEPWARALWDAGVRPRAAAVGYGLLQVSDPGRFQPRGPLAPWIRGNIRGVAAGYLGDPDLAPGRAGLADPLLVLESGLRPDRPLPRFYVGAGDRDPLLDDTRRLGAALARLDVPHEVRVYPGGIHGFHVLLPWTDLARAMWRDQLDFVARALAAPIDPGAIDAVTSSRRGAVMAEMRAA
jgi:acetyl esterase